MHDKTLAKLMLDIVLAVLFLILIEPHNTGMAFHEILGLSIGVLFTVHIILNWSWVRRTTKSLFNPKFNTKPKLFYVLNVISFISVATMIFTGIQISQVLFASESAVIDHNFVFVHKWVANFCLGLFSVHIVLHWHFISSAICKLFTKLKTSNFSKAVASVAVTVLVISLLYSQIASSSADDANQVRVESEPPMHRHEFNHAKPMKRYENNIPRSNGATVYEYSAEENQDSSISTDTSNDGDVTTLNDFLDDIFCNGCSNHCSLLNPQCEKGAQQQEFNKIQYQQKYGTQD